MQQMRLAGGLSYFALTLKAIGKKASRPLWSEAEVSR
jgi:hypothetical protein